MGKRILLVGNGFDKAHKLPTDYMDFLKVCNSMRMRKVRPVIGYESDDVFEKFCQNVTDGEYASFRKMIVNNYWIEYFIEQKGKFGLKWIDFEMEIQDVVESIYAEQINNGKKAILKSDVILNRVYQIHHPQKKPTIMEAFNYVKEELNRIISALNLYFELFVRKLDPDKIHFFQDETFDMLLSFNKKRCGNCYNNK